MPKHAIATKRYIPTSKGAQRKIHKVMREYKHRALHTGSKTGPLVKSRKQAIAIALSEGRHYRKK